MRPFDADLAALADAARTLASAKLTTCLVAFWIWSNAAVEAANDPRFVAAMATVETPIQYLDAPELARFWEADAQKLAEAVRRVGKVE